MTDDKTYKHSTKEILDANNTVCYTSGTYKADKTYTNEVTLYSATGDVRKVWHQEERSKATRLYSRLCRLFGDYCQVTIESGVTVGQ